MSVTPLPVEPEFDPPFILSEPRRQTVPVVFNAPHAGCVYPRGFLGQSRLDPLSLRKSEDAHVDQLLSGMVDLGAPLLAARFPRAFLDVNREPYELDPRMFEGRLPPHANTRSMRVAGGLGTVPRIVADGQEIYRGKLPAAEAMRRIEWLYKPYHRMVAHLLARTAKAFGTAVLVDGHSMPSATLSREEASRADIVLGDRYGTSCAGIVTDRLEAGLKDRGYTVVRNKPYAGGYITEHYGDPASGRHAIQIELNRALYMNERTLEPHDGFERLRRDLTGVMAEFLENVGDDLAPPRMAAE